MRQLRVTAVAVGLVLCIAAAASAQDTSPLKPGARIRVVASMVTEVGRPVYPHGPMAPPLSPQEWAEADFTLRLLVGKLRELGPETLVMNPEHESDPLRVPVTDIKSLDVSVAQTSKTGDAAGTAMLIGVGIGTLWGASWASGHDASTIEGIGRGALYFGLPAAALGLFLGSHIRADHWQPIPLSSIQAAVIGSGSGLGLALRVPLDGP